MENKLYLPYQKTVFFKEFPNIPFIITPIISNAHILLILNYTKDDYFTNIPEKIIKNIVKKFPFLRFKEFHASHVNAQYEVKIFFEFDDILPLIEYITTIVRFILLCCNTNENEIKEISFVQNPNEISSGIICIKININCYGEIEEYAIWNHINFLKETIKKNINLPILILLYQFES